jgi:hypothetical protein
LGHHVHRELRLEAAELLAGRVVRREQALGKRRQPGAAAACHEYERRAERACLGAEQVPGAAVGHAERSRGSAQRGAAADRAQQRQQARIEGGAPAPGHFRHQFHMQRITY